MCTVISAVMPISGLRYGWMSMLLALSTASIFFGRWTAAYMGRSSGSFFSIHFTQRIFFSYDEVF
jgi:hypothetical protein